MPKLTCDVELVFDEVGYCSIRLSYPGKPDTWIDITLMSADDIKDVTARPLFEQSLLHMLMKEE